MNINATIKEEDRVLLLSIKRGDEKSFDKIFRKYYSALCAYGNKFVEMEDAEECVQDAFVWIWNNKENLIIENSLASYLFAIVHNGVLNKIEQKESNRRKELYYYEEFKDELSNPDFYFFDELTKHIETAIEHLPPSYKEAFVMHRFQDKSYKEIAEVLGVSPKTVDYRIQQALKQLRIELKDYLPCLFLLINNF